MKFQDQLLLEQAYNSVFEEQQILKELNSLPLQEGVGEIWNSVTGAVTNVSDLPQKIATWSQLALPDYITKMADFLLSAGWHFLAGSGGTYALGLLLMYLSKKMSKEADQNYDALKSMLPSIVQDKIKEIEHLKDTNPQEYKLKVFEINKNSLIELKKQLNQKGIKTDKGVLAKTLNYMGKFLTSAAGVLSGGIIIPLLIYKLGFNPLPIFPQIQ